MSIVNDLAAELGIDPSTLYDHLLGAGEALQPTYLTTTPAGAIGADFSGHVHAQGLDLDAGGTTTPPSSDRIRWLRTADGQSIAELYAQENINDALLIQAINPDQANDVALLQLIANRTAPTQILITANGASQITHLLLDENDKSDFLKLVTAAARKIDFGNTTLTWGGASPVATATVNHALGVTPIAVLALCAGTSSGFATAAYAPSLPTTTKLFLGATAQGGTPPNGSTAALWWLVIG